MICTALYLAMLAATDAKTCARTEQVVGALKNYPTESTKTSAAAAKIQSLVNINAVVQSTLAPKASQLKSAAGKLVERRLKDIIGLGAFPKAGALFRRSEVKIVECSDTPEGGLAKMTIREQGKDMEVALSLVFAAAKNSDLKVVDFLLDGDSMVKEYQGQIARFIDKEGAPKLAERLASKLKDMQAAPK